jgi:hypothetical protein
VIFPDVDPTAPQPTPAKPPLPGLPGLPRNPGPSLDPLLPPPPGGGYGILESPPPVEAGPPASNRRGTTAVAAPAEFHFQQPTIQPVLPPAGTQARLMPQGSPQFLPAPTPPNWGQGVAPSGAVAPAVYQR